MQYGEKLKPKYDDPFFRPPLEGIQPGYHVQHLKLPLVEEVVVELPVEEISNE